MNQRTEIPHRRPFFEKLRTSLLKRRVAMARAGASAFRARYFGADFIVDLADEVGREIAINRFEWRELKLMLDACRRLKPDVFIDVGANLGLYTCVIGRHGAAPRILAFEPDRENLARLQANVALNELASIVEVHVAAVGERARTAMLAAAGSENRGLSRIDDDAAGAYSVPMVALDDMVKLDGRSFAAKVDVEGYELEVLTGAKALFSRNGGFAQIEGRDDRAAHLITERMHNLGWRFVERYGLDLRFEKP